MITFTEIEIASSKDGEPTFFGEIRRGISETNEQVERKAHVQAALELERRFPGQWMYAVSTGDALVKGTTINTPGVVIDYRYGEGFVQDVDQPYIAGVTDMALLTRFDYQFHWRKSVDSGYVPAVVTSHDPEAEASRDIAIAVHTAEHEAKLKARRERIEGLPPFTVSDEAAKQRWYEKNKDDDYGMGVLNYADAWARLFEAELESNTNLGDLFEHTSSEADYEGITGFMYGMAVQYLSQVWAYGTQLRVWHNKQFGHESEGVVNPALLTIG